MNESETRAEYIDPKLKESGWGITADSKILREYNITIGKIQTGGGRAKPLIADYVLVYHGQKLASAGYGRDELSTLQKLIDAEKSDLFDVLEYVSFAMKPISRETRVERAKSKIYRDLNTNQKEFLKFVLSKYIESGVEELDQEKLPGLLTLKYQAIRDAEEILGGVEKIRATFIDFQKYLYEEIV